MENIFEIKKSPIEGRGVFASKPIKRGELICIMNGEEISIDELKKRYNSGQERLSDPLQIGEERYIDLEEPYVLINHCCDPNATILGLNKLIAINDIDIGQEITYDYSLTEWSDNKFWHGYDEWFIECKCDYVFCRKKVGEFNSIPKPIQKLQIDKGNVRDFIVRKYNDAENK